MKDTCSLLPRRLCFVHMGKLGDEMILLPGLKHIYDETGVKPVVVVGREFASIFEGVSYAIADPVMLSWYQEVELACNYAHSKYGHFICPKWWDNKALPPPPPPLNSRLTTIQFMGRDIVLAESSWESYQVSQWESAGFTRQQMVEWPLVFDRRSAVREAELRKQFFRTKKPKLLLAISGPGTSPFPAVPEIMQVINQFRGDFEIIDLSRMMATRIYDLLGLYDHAAGLIVNDSAPLHLASASQVPYVAFVNNGGSGSIPKGNCVFSVRYQNVMGARNQLANVLRTWKGEEPRLPAFAPSGGGNAAYAMAR